MPLAPIAILYHGRMRSRLGCAAAVALLGVTALACDAARHLVVNGAGRASATGGAGGARTNASATGGAGGARTDTSATSGAGGARTNASATGGAGGARTATSATSGAGGASVSGTGGAGGSVALDPTAVCDAAVRAQAERMALCLGSDPVDSLMLIAVACPEYYFNSDSNRTVETVAACLLALAARTCTDVTLSLMPTCLARGARAASESCAFPSQCQSGLCDGYGRRCGTCHAGDKPAGSACTMTYDCAAGTYCNYGSNTCVDNGTMIYAPEAHACDLYGTPAVGCFGDLYCKPAGDGGAAGICTAAPMLGQPCGRNGINSTTICAAGTTCTSGICDLPGDCGGVSCDSASYCATTSGGPRCASRAVVGEACSDSAASTLPPCLAPATCGSQGLCSVPRQAGEACDAANPCGALLMCQAGTCEAIVAASCPA